MIQDTIAEVRWFFGQTLVWIWGNDLLSAARLGAIRRLPVYGVRLGSWALYVVHLEQHTAETLNKQADLYCRCSSVWCMDNHQYIDQVHAKKG